MKLLSQPMLALLLDQDQRVGYLLLAGPYGGFMALSVWLSQMATKAGSSAGYTGAYTFAPLYSALTARRATETTGSTCASTPGYDYQYGSVRSAV
jgi:hypothetical protein|uniref:Uncharacterized protein n=2 Tax=Picea TaxID=3328 RepID=A0A6B9XSE0_PICSI|nr:hypothetical protein Q903MT_gene3940 [Picea sitchensis]